MMCSPLATFDSLIYASQLLTKQRTSSAVPQVLVLPQKQQRIPYYSILLAYNGPQTNNRG